MTALGLVATAVGAGELTPEEGASVAAVLEIKRKAIETADLEMVFHEPLARARQIRSQEQRHRGFKIYSFHAPEVVSSMTPRN